MITGTRSAPSTSCTRLTWPRKSVGLSARLALYSAFDVGRKTFRSEIFAEYKANRAESPTDFRGQVSLVQEVLGALRVPVITAEGYEADDVIATLTVQAVEQGIDVLIGTGDRDALQLVNEHVRCSTRARASRT